MICSSMHLQHARASLFSVAFTASSPFLISTVDGGHRMIGQSQPMRNPAFGPGVANGVKPEGSLRCAGAQLPRSGMSPNDRVCSEHRRVGRSSRRGAAGAES